MEDITGRIRELLSDPESVQQLSELAAMLRESGDAPADADAAPSDAQTQTDAPDLTKLFAVGQMLAQMQQDDDNTALLLALKPHLSEKRQQRVGRAVRLLRLYRAASALQENGLLSELIGSM